MGNCKDCKYYRIGHFDYNDNKEKVFIDTDIADIRSYTICFNDKISSDSIDKWFNRAIGEREDGVYAECDEERAWLHIGKNFGCIHFEQKEE
jgi:hypothetical protein